MGSLVLIAIGIGVAWYIFRSKERADTSARLLAEASYIQGQIDATPGPPDAGQVSKMVSLIVAARPDIVEALACMPAEKAVDEAFALAMAVFPGQKPYTQLALVAALAAGADKLRQADRPQAGA